MLEKPICGRLIKDLEEIKILLKIVKELFILDFLNCSNN